MLLRRGFAGMLFLCLLCLSVAQGATRTNQLANHASPYLAMHGQDPVHWQKWGKAVQQAALRENKLIYISSGYFSCHWCHVMQRESYSNPEIAALLNRHFIAVKIDRELNPALDARLIDFVENTRGHAGWPLNVFITPEGYPLVGLVYQPPDNFKALLENIAGRWQKESAALKNMAKDTTAELSKPQLGTSAKLAEGLGQRYGSRLLQQSLQIADDMLGGFGQQRKFPSVPQLRVLMALQVGEQAVKVTHFIKVTLDQMASQGLNDQLSGGFFRYTVDPSWHTPHFEKMLNDNAQLARLYLIAANRYKVPRYRNIAFTTLDFMLRDLATSDAGLATSLSAVDKDGVEGGAYLWQPEVLKKLLRQDEWQLVKRLWGLEGKPQFEAGYHLVSTMKLVDVAKQLALSETRAKALLASARGKMQRARAARPAPKDDKRLAAWNGLALSALVLAAQQPGGEKYHQPAQQLRDYLLGQFWDGKRLQRSRLGKQVIGKAGLEDYAYVAEGLWAWAKWHNKKADYVLVNALVHSAWQRFYGAQGWLLTEDLWLKYGRGETLLADGVMTSPSSVLMDISLRLAGRNDDAAWRKKIVRALNVGDAEITQAPFWYASHILLIQQVQQTKI